MVLVRPVPAAPPPLHPLAHGPLACTAPLSTPRCVEAYKAANKGATPDMYANGHGYGSRRRLLSGYPEYGPQLPPREPVRTLCLRDWDGTMLHLGHGTPGDCNAYAARRHLMGASDPGVLVFEAKETVPDGAGEGWLGSPGSGLAKGGRRRRTVWHVARAACTAVAATGARLLRTPGSTPHLQPSWPLP